MTNIKPVVGMPILDAPEVEQLGIERSTSPTANEPGRDAVFSSPLVLDGRRVRIGSVGVLAQNDMALLRALLVPGGTVRRTPGASDRWYGYEAMVARVKHSPGRFEVRIRVDSQHNLRELQAQATQSLEAREAALPTVSHFFYPDAGASVTPGLACLPNELLSTIIADSVSDGQGGQKVKLCLRHVSKRLKDVADYHRSNAERFMMTHAEQLERARYSPGAMKELAGLGQDQQDFVLREGFALTASGFRGFATNELSARSDEDQHFVLRNGLKLKQAGFSPKGIMKLLGTLQGTQRDFVVQHGHALSKAAYLPFSIMELAARPVEQRNFVLDQHRLLYIIRYTGFDMNDLASRPIVQQQFVRDHGLVLKGLGYHGAAINKLAERPESERQFILTDGHKLQASGCRCFTMNLLARKSHSHREFVATHGVALKFIGYTPMEMGHLAECSPDQSKLIVAHGETLALAGYRPSVMNDFARTSDVSLERLLRDIDNDQV